MIVGALAAAIWGYGAWRGLPASQRLAMVALLWLAVIALHLALPETSTLRGILGGDAKVWTIAGGILALGAGYASALIYAKKNAIFPQKSPEIETHSPIFSPAELSRYSRHILLREIGGAGQARLKSARVLVVGAGGLGSPALMYLAAAGVGTIGVIDDDLVDESNLGRQVIHDAAALGLPKVQSAQAALKAQNPNVTVLPYQRKLDRASQTLIADYDLILDGSDNMETRYLVNAACVAAGKPLISAALTQWEGQISLYRPPHAPCFACVFPAAPEAGLAPACAEAGVLSPLPGVIGALMAVEAIKHLTGAGQTLAGRLMIYDALDAQTRLIKIARDPNCPVCGPTT